MAKQLTEKDVRRIVDEHIAAATPIIIKVAARQFDARVQRKRI